MLLRLAWWVMVMANAVMKIIVPAAFLVALAAAPIAGMWVSVRVGTWMQWSTFQTGALMAAWLFLFYWTRPLYYRRCLRLLRSATRFRQAWGRSTESLGIRLGHG